MPSTMSSDLHPVNGGQHSAALHPVFNLAAAPTDDPNRALALSATRAALMEDGEETALRQLHPPTAANALMMWDAAVRVDVCTFEVGSRLRFAGGSFWHGDPGAAGSVELVKFTAPAQVDASGAPSALLQAQLAMVIDMAAQRADRQPEVLVQQSDFWSFWTAVTHVDPARARRTAELIDVAYRMATAATMRLKHDMRVLRPSDVSVHVLPMIDVPGHGAFPSGHATVSYLFARVMTQLLDAQGTPLEVKLQRLANRVSENRVIAGVHFPMDSLAGRLLGHVLGDYFLARCGSTAMTTAGSSFDAAAAVDGTQLVIKPGEVDSIIATRAESPPYVIGSATLAPAPLATSEPLTLLWQAARAELANLHLRGTAP